MDGSNMLSVHMFRYYYKLDTLPPPSLPYISRQGQNGHDVEMHTSDKQRKQDITSRTRRHKQPEETINKGFLSEIPKHFCELWLRTL